MQYADYSPFAAIIADNRSTTQQLMLAGRQVRTSPYVCRAKGVPVGYLGHGEQDDLCP